MKICGCREMNEKRWLKRDGEKCREVGGAAMGRKE
jgi:hypothetical protein